MYDIEKVGRKAIDQIKQKYCLPDHGILAGGSIANTVWELVSGNKAIINDIDIFILQELIPNIDANNSIFTYQKKEIVNYEDYKGIKCIHARTGNFYQISNTDRSGILNIIKYQSNNPDPNIILDSFDINATQIGYDIGNDKLYWTPHFENFISTGELKITNLMTPSHTAIRIAKKKRELNAKLDDFEFRIIQSALSTPLIDIIKTGFLKENLEKCIKNSDILKNFFNIRKRYKDPFFPHHENTIGDIYELIPITIPDDLSQFNINNDTFLSSDLLFYARIVKSNEYFKKLWNVVSPWFTNEDYADIKINDEDLSLISKLLYNAPNCIDNLKGLKLSEQVKIIKKLLDKFKDDPIISISILENHKLDKDIILDDETSLLLELSVRKQIIDDPYNKVKKILEIPEVTADTQLIDL